MGNKLMTDTIISSASKEVVLGFDRPFVIIGERINPTGRKLLAEEMKTGDFSRVEADAMAQVAAGAHVLDVNAGIPLADEPALLARAIRLVQSLTDVPLSIDSSVPEALEAGLEAYQGKALLNSVTGEEERLEYILPLVKKHGAAVVAICNDDSGISTDINVRFDVARKIVNRAADHGIPVCDVVVDPLVMPVGAMAKQVLAFCMDQVLRLWHPTMPFITERLWEQLNAIAPSRGFPGVVELATDTDLVVAAFPPVEGYPAIEDETILDVFAEIQSVVRAVRDLRLQCDVSPKEAVMATVVLPEAECDAFKAQAHIVLRMANVSDLTVDREAKRPANAGSITIGSLRVFVHDISDDEAERARATKQLADLQKQITGKEGKLGNEKFVANAKPEIVEAERQRLSELTAQRDGLQQHLAELDS